MAINYFHDYLSVDMRVLLCVDWERFCNPHSCTAVMEHASAEICGSTLTFKAQAWSMRLGGHHALLLTGGVLMKDSTSQLPSVIFKEAFVPSTPLVTGSANYPSQNARHY